MSNLVILRRFRDLPDALLAWSLLDSTGIESFLIDEIMIRMDWLWSNLLGGVKICVMPEDAEDAMQVLNLDIPEKFNVEGVGEFEQPWCPKCHSLNISYENFNKPATYAITFLLCLPIQIGRRRCICQSCRHDWKPADESEQTT